MDQPAVSLQPVTYRAISAILATGVLTLGGLLTLHNQVLVPSMLHAVDRMMSERIERHEARPHADSVSRSELEGLRSEFRDDLARMEAKVDRLLEASRK